MCPALELREYPVLPIREPVERLLREPLRTLIVHSEREVLLNRCSLERGLKTPRCIGLAPKNPARVESGDCLCRAKPIWADHQGVHETIVAGTVQLSLRVLWLAPTGGLVCRTA